MMLREQAAGAEAARLERESVLATELRASLEERLTQLEERERALEREGREQSRKFLLEARRRVEEAIAAARADDTPTTQKEARRLVEDGVREHAEALAKLKREGWRVTSRNGEGRAGGKAATPERSGGTGARARAAEHDAGGPGGRSSVPDVEARAEVNLRGMTGDEAVFELIRALDSAAAADLPFVRIIHGKGTGALRARVSEVLRRDGRVRKFNVAPPHQGGTGVTIAELQS